MTVKECKAFLKTIGDVENIETLAISCNTDEGRQEFVDYIKANNITCFNVWESDDDTPYLNWEKIFYKSMEIGKKYC